MQSINTQGNFSSYRSASTQNQAPSEQAPQYQQGQFALNQNELNAIHALTAAGVVSTALLNPSTAASLGNSSLWGPFGWIQSSWQDEDRLGRMAYNNIVPFRNLYDLKKHNAMHYAKEGYLGRNIVYATGLKDGGIITDAKGNALVPPKASPKWWNPFSWGNKNPEIQISAASQRALEQGATVANGVNTAGKQALFKAELHTPNHMYNLNAKSQWNLNPFSGEMHGRKYGNKFGRYHNAGVSGDMTVAQGSTGRVTQEALNHGKKLEEIDKLKVQQQATKSKLLNSDGTWKTVDGDGVTRTQMVKDTTNGKFKTETITDNTELGARKAARSAKIKQAQNTYQTLDTVRLEQAANDLSHKQRIVDLDTKMLEDLNTKHPHPTGKVAEQIQALKERLTQNQQLLNDQKLHFDKLNRRNAQFQKVHTAQNLDDIAGNITKTKPNWFQKIANFNIFKPHENLTEKATQMLLEENLKDLGLTKDQLKQVQSAVAQGDDAVKNALTKIMAENRAMADVVGEGIHATTTPKAGVGLKNAPSAKVVAKNADDLIKTGGKVIAKNTDDALEATLQAKNASSVGRNALGLGAKFTKALAALGIVLEGANAINNIRNGDYRKATSDLTTSVVSTGATLGLAALVLNPLGIGLVGSTLAMMAVGFGVSALAGPLIDKGIKKFTGLTNKDERDAAKAEQDKARLQTLLAN
jgi:hypothetical protein